MNFAENLGKEIIPRLYYFDEASHNVYFFRKGPIGIFEPVPYSELVKKKYIGSEEHEKAYQASCKIKLP